MLIQMVKLMMKDTACRVRINSMLSDRFRVKHVLRQRDPLSTTLFDLKLEKC